MNPFSSPVGDWWFDVEQIKDTCLTKFSSPSGDGLVPDSGIGYHLRKAFSSPLGDGLVLQILTEILKNQVIRYRHNKQL